MAHRDDIVEWTNDYLRLHEFKDFGPMGLQYTGKESVQKIATAVSVSYDVIQRAVEWGADMLFTHHGLWWNNESRTLDQRTAGRIALAREHDISILGYHLCLDAHPEIGNNILLAKELHLGDLVPFGEIGWGGKLQIGNSNFWNDWNVYRAKYFPHEWHLVYPYGPEQIHRVAVIAGGAPQYLTQAHKEGYDLFVTGEAAEFTYYQAQELNMHFVAAGHHQTERAGIIELGKRLKTEFSVEEKFFDAANRV